MGRLLHQRSKRETDLLPTHRIGRARENELRVEGAYASLFHACLIWTATGWQLRDLGSRNGTFVNGRMLGKSERVLVKEGDAIAFGADDDPWTLVESGPPPASAANALSGERVSAQNGLLILRAADGITAQIFQERSGDWVAEVDGEQRMIVDGGGLELGPDRWSLSLPMAPDTTTETRESGEAASSVAPLGGATLHFRVSADQEHVILTVRRGENVWQSERIYTHVLLALARQRLSDQELPGLDTGEQGWVYADEFCSRLGDMDLQRLNLEIFRARQELARHGIPNSADIVERRRGTGQLRLGTARVEIEQFRGALGAF